MKIILHKNYLHLKQQKLKNVWNNISNNILAMKAYIKLETL